MCVPSIHIVVCLVRMAWPVTTACRARSQAWLDWANGNSENFGEESRNLHKRKCPHSKFEARKDPISSSTPKAAFKKAKGFLILFALTVPNPLHLWLWYLLFRTTRLFNSFSSPARFYQPEETVGRDKMAVVGVDFGTLHSKVRIYTTRPHSCTSLHIDRKKLTLLVLCRFRSVSRDTEV